MSSRVGGSEDVTPGAAAAPGAPHPLAAGLASKLRSWQEPRIVILGVGSGRNVPVFLTAGCRVDIVEDNEERAIAATRRFRHEARIRVGRGRYVDPIRFEAPFDAALSTHALLHGTPPDIAVAIAEVHAVLKPGGAFFATIGSKRDPRFEKGHRIAPDTFASDDGGEAGVAHAYFDEAGVRAAFAGFVLEDVAEMAAGDAVGRWAHSEREASGIVQWWVRAKRDQ